MRVVAPVVLTYGLCGLDTSEYGCLGAAIIGAFIGATSSIAVDASALAYEDVTVVPRVMPTASITKDRATFGFSASF